MLAALPRRALRRVLPARGPGPRGVRRALPADDRPGHGQGRRGHRVLPLPAPDRAQRGRRRPGPLLAARSRTSTGPTRRAPSASRDQCSPRRPTTPSAAATFGRASARSPRAAAEWAELVHALARGQRARCARGRARIANEEYLIYQTLVGAWPIEPDRLRAYLEKALREAERNTDWAHPDEAWEASVTDFARALYDHEPFRALLRPVRRAIARGRRADRARRAAAAPHLPGRPRHLPGRRAVVAEPRRPRQSPAGRLGGAPPRARRPPSRRGARAATCRSST